MFGSVEKCSHNVAYDVEIINGIDRRQGSCEPGQTVLELLQHTGLTIFAPCGGKGSCGKWRVTINHEKTSRSVRACMTKAEPGMTVILPEMPLMIICDSTHIALSGCYPPDPLPKDPPLHASDHPSPSPDSDMSHQVWGIAVDVGTTTVVARLLDLSTGELLASAAHTNPQTVYGADVLSRINACEQYGLETMAVLIRHGISRLIDELMASAGTSGRCARAELRQTDLETGTQACIEASPGQIRRIALTGNTIMEHIAAELSPHSIGVTPFTPLTLFGDEHLLEGLPAPVWMAPAIAAYVGGDISCDLLTLQVLSSPAPLLLIDLGTNGEIALYDGKRIHCCATAAGPTFEGAGVHFGMAAMPGAICHVALRQDGSIQLDTVDNAPVCGICGTGLISAVSALLEAGLVDETGLLCDASAAAQPFAHLLGFESIGRWEQTVFYLTPDHSYFITQGDIRGLQLAKAAIRAGVETLLEETGLCSANIGRVALAGGFGAALDARSALRVGLIPPEMSRVVEAVGNMAIEGISAALLSARARTDLATIVSRCAYHELSTSTLFNHHFMKHMDFREAGAGTAGLITKRFHGASEE